MSLYVSYWGRRREELAIAGGTSCWRRIPLRHDSLDERGLGARVRVADPDDEREPADGNGGLGLASSRWR